MTIIPLLILASLGLAGAALIGFVWAVKTGQFEDTTTPSIRILTDDPEVRQGNEQEGKRKNNKN